jgi:tripartite-type tricarboxylate transporter receptor subunit TctC
MKRLLLALVAAAAVVVDPALSADDFPSRPITFVPVFGPGSASDTVCRIIGDQLSAELKTSVVVEPRPGADGAIAATYVSRAAPDGYTLMLATNSPLSAAPFLIKTSYDAIKDFTPVSRVGSFTLMIVVNPSVPIHSLAELVSYAKANPGKLSFASGNTAGIVAIATINRWAGTDIVHVPYKTTPPALQDVMAGRVSMMLADFTTASPHVKSGALRAIAVSRIKRSSLFPDLPTIDESGLTGFNLDTWAAFVAPAKTPPAVVTKLNAALRKVIDQPDVQAKFKNVGFEGFSSTPEELGDYIKVQLTMWGKMIKDAGIGVESGQ